MTNKYFIYYKKIINIIYYFNMNTNWPSLPDYYKHPHLIVADRATGQHRKLNPKDFSGIETVPDFAAHWGISAATSVDTQNILTATLNSSFWCPVWVNKICGEFCFAFNQWQWSGIKVKCDLPEKYDADMQLLEEEGAQVGIFMSYDSEPFSTPEVTEVTKRLLRNIIKRPPAALLIHSRTSEIGRKDVLELLQEVNQATNLLVGVAFETDTEEYWKYAHAFPVLERKKSLESLTGLWFKTQLTTAPLLGYKDYEGFARHMREIGVHRVMFGQLRTSLETGWAQRALGIENCGLHIPSEAEVIQICKWLKFPGWASTREDFYIRM